MREIAYTGKTMTSSGANKSGISVPLPISFAGVISFLQRVCLDVVYHSFLSKTAAARKRPCRFSQVLNANFIGAMQGTNFIICLKQISKSLILEVSLS